MTTKATFDIEEDLDFILEKQLPEWIMMEKPKKEKKQYPTSFKSWGVYLLNSTLSHTKDIVLQQMIRAELALRGA